jgi:hypothetical protein
VESNMGIITMGSRYFLPKNLSLKRRANPKPARSSEKVERTANSNVFLMLIKKNLSLTNLIKFLNPT